ncbi:MAG: CRISPR-associated helicase Cas3' [Thermoguttaceae bacterium]
MKSVTIFDRLLAKGVRSGIEIPAVALLPRHLIDVHNSALAVLDASGDAQLSAVGLCADDWRDRLRQVVRVAAAVHDLGKANDHFQRIVHGDRSHAQGLRHEWVTYLMLREPAMCQWLLLALSDPEDYVFVLWAVCGHHRESAPTKSASGTQMEVYWSHPDFRKSLAWIGNEFRLPTAPLREDELLPLTNILTGNAMVRIKKALDEDFALWATVSESRRRFAAVCKACLIAVDVAASALAKRLTHARRQRWLTAVLKVRPGSQQLHTLVRERLGGKALRPFQEAVAGPRNRVVLVRAGCGTGKTVAAYHRAATCWPDRRIYFCYPTTGTATEGFRGYLLDAETRRSKLGARLFHGRAKVDREMILCQRGDEDEFEALARAESLEAWSAPAVCCTADTVLGLLQNHRRGLFAWPALAQSAFVFDEIHAYPDRLFGALLRFIGTLRGVPVLLMTASLPNARRRAIEECLSTNGESLAEVFGPADLETLPRYRLLAGAEPLSCARQEWAAGGKVLWVCNTVARVMQTAESLRDLSPLVYHSHFRYEDRVHQHLAVVEAFEQGRAEPALAVCSQVAEMSLDLSATLLVTEIAPVPSCIQRLGRLNRWGVPPRDGESPPVAMPFIVVEPLQAGGTRATTPYDPREYGDWWTATRDWLGALGTGELSQADLATCWQSMYADAPMTPAGSTWLDGGPLTLVGDLREPSPGISVILEGRDATEVATGRKPAVLVALPMPSPRSRDWRKWGRVNGWPVAPAGTITYSPFLGGEWI